MFRAALKSLLGRKVRLLMSTFAIVIGVSFVVGTLVFSDTLSRSFTALMASTVGDVVVRPVGTDAASEPTTRTVDADAGRRARGRRGRRPGRRQRDRLRRLRRRQGRQADRRQRARPASAATGPTRPPATTSRAWTSSPAARRRRPARCCSTRTTAGEGGYIIGQDVNLVTGHRPRRPDAPTLVGIIGFPEGGSLNGATFTAFDTRTAQELLPRRARTPSPTSG